MEEELLQEYIRKHKEGEPLHPDAAKVILKKTRLAVYENYWKIPRGDPEDFEGTAIFTVFTKLKKHNLQFATRTWIDAVVGNLAKYHARKWILRRNKEGELVPPARSKRVSFEAIQTNEGEYEERFPSDTISPDEYAQRTVNNLQAIPFIAGFFTQKLFRGQETQEAMERIYCAYLLGHEYETIKDALDIPKGTVRSRISRVKGKLAAVARTSERSLPLYTKLGEQVLRKRLFWKVRPWRTDNLYFGGIRVNEIYQETNLDEEQMRTWEYLITTASGLPRQQTKRAIGTYLEMSEERVEKTIHSTKRSLEYAIERQMQKNILYSFRIAA